MGTCLVTGANRGLGLEFCRQLVAAGDTVVATTRRPEPQRAFDGVDEATSSRFETAALDVTDPDSIARCAEQVAARHDRLDLLVNNAGVWADDAQPQASAGPLGALDADAVDVVLRTNAIGPLLVTQAFRSLLPGGTVVNLSSGLGSLTRNVPVGNYGYTVSKAAVNMVTRKVATELAAQETVVVSLDPGWVRTGLGGPSGRIDPPEAVAGLLAVVAGLDLDASGGFYNRHGEAVAW